MVHEIRTECLLLRPLFGGPPGMEFPRVNMALARAAFEATAS